MVVVKKVRMDLKLPSGHLQRAAITDNLPEPATIAEMTNNAAIEAAMNARQGDFGPEAVDVPILAPPPPHDVVIVASDEQRPPRLPPPVDDDVPEEEERRPRKRTRNGVPSTINRQVLKTPNNESEKLETNQALLECAARLDGAVSELLGYARTLSDQTRENEGRRREAVKNVRESIVPMLHIASRFLRDTGMSFAPFGGTRSLHLRSEAKRKREVVDPLDNGKSPALQLIDDFVRHSVVEMPEHLVAAAADDDSEPAATATRGKKIPEGQGHIPPGEETVTVALPRPINGTEYCKSEALRAAKMYKTGRDRAIAIRAMCERRLAPASTKTIYRLIQADEEGYPIVDENWHGPGRPGQFPPNYVHKHQPNPNLVKPSTDDMVEVTLTKREKKKNKKATKPNNIKVESDLKLAANAKQAAKKQPAKRSATKPAAAPKKLARKPDLKPTDKDVPKKVMDFPLPPPREGNVYKKSEAVEIARVHPKGSPLRRTCIEAMLYCGYVPNSVKSVYRLLQREEKGLPIIDNEWGVPGCPPLLSNGEVDAIIERLKQGVGRIYCRADVEQILVNAVREKIARQGRDPDEVAIRFSKTSVRNYCTMFKSKLSSMYWTGTE